MAKPSISIVVPVYNSEQYLPACLDSLVSQSLEAIEVVCVNDGSTDGSLSILDDYASRDARVRVISQGNGGVSKARNRGMLESLGEYVLFVDSDDMLLSGACAELLAIARQDGSDIVCFGGKTFPTLGWADDSFAKRRYTYPKGRSVEALLYEAGSTPLMCNKMYRSELLRSSGVRFNEALTLGEDNAFQFCIFPHAGIVSYTESMLYYYRVHGASAVALNRSDAGSRIEKHIEVVCYVCSQWHDIGLVPSHGKELLEWLIGFLYDDFVNSPYKTRRAIALLLEDLVSACFPPSAVESLGDEQWYRLHQMTEAILAQHDNPLVSFVVRHVVDGYLDSDEFASIVCQSEPNIEILLIPDSECEGDLLAEKMASEGSIVEGDGRCRIADMDSLDDLSRQCGGDWVLVTSAGCSYELSTAAQLVDHLDALGKVEKHGAGGAPVFKRGEYVRGSDARKVDVVVFDDANAHVRTEDVFFLNVPSVEKPLNPHGLYNHADLDVRLLSVTGLTTSNKLYSKRFISRFGDDPNKKYGDFGISLALAVEEAEAISIFKMPLLSYGVPSAWTQCGYATDAACPVGASGVERWCSVVLVTADGRVRKDRLSALFCYYMGILDALSDFGAFERVFAPCQKNLAILVREAGVFPEFAERDDELLADALLSRDCHDYFELKMVHSFRKASEQSGRAMRQLGEEAAAVARLNGDIRDFYQSISYRVGRAVTLPMRKVFYAFKTFKDRG